MGRWVSPELVSTALQGDVAAVEHLVAAVWPGCFRLAASVLGDRSLAEDAAQEACAIVHRKVRSLRSADAFDSWLYRVVMREAAKVRRRNVAFDDRVPERSVEVDGATSMDVWEALSALSPPLREVIVLFYFDDLKSHEIAEILRIPHATVRTRLAKARERLRDLLGDYADISISTEMEAKHYAV
jgi:RNA polymerase sigma-70 factor (ECF subfamily)